MIEAITPSTTPSCQSTVTSEWGGIWELSAFGGMGGFYTIANGIIDGVVSSLNSDRANKLFSFLNATPGTGGPAFIDVIDDANSQVGADIFVGIGGGLVLLSWVIAILIISFRWCCCQSCWNKRPEFIGSRIGLACQAAVYFTAFAFVLTSMILYAVSLNNFDTSIKYGVQDYRTMITNDIYNTSRKSNAQMNCAYNNILANGYSKSQNALLNEPNNAVVAWNQYTGVLDLQNFDEVNLQQNLIGTAEQARLTIGLLQSLKTDPTLQQNMYQNEIQRQINNLQVSMQQAKDLNKTMDSVVYFTPITLNDAAAKSNHVNSAVYKSLTGLRSSISDAQQKQSAVANSLISSGDTSNAWAQQLINKYQTGAEIAYTDAQYPLIMSMAQLAMYGPTSFALFFIFIGFACCIYRFIFRVEPNHRSSISNAVGNVLIIGFYIVILTCWIVIATAGALYWFTYVFATSCNSLYSTNGPYDFYRNQPNPVIQGTYFDGSTTTLNYDIFTSSLWSSQTIFRAMTSFQGGRDLIDTYDVNNFISKGYNSNKMRDNINALNLSVSFDINTMLNMQRQSGLLYNSAQTFDQTASTTGFLPLSCSVSVAACNAGLSLQSFTTQQDYTSTTTNTLSDILTTITNSYERNSQTTIANQVDGSANQQIGATNTVTSSFVAALQSYVYPTRPLYDNYANGGWVMCDFVRPTMNGLWAAAGLAFFFLIPSAIALLYTSTSMLKGMKAELVGVSTQYSVQEVGPPRQVVYTQPNPTIFIQQPQVLQVVEASAPIPNMYPVLVQEEVSFRM